MSTILTGRVIRSKINVQGRWQTGQILDAATGASIEVVRGNATQFQF